jgi:hypothetical protein
VGPYTGLPGLVLSVPLEVDDLMVRVEFGESGRVVRLFDNLFYLPDVFPEFIVDGQVHPSALPFVSYAMQSYGLTVGEQIAVLAPIRVFLHRGRTIQDLRPARVMVHIRAKEPSRRPLGATPRARLY